MTVKIINTSNNALPNYETEGSAGMDLRANITESITLGPLERAMIPTGIFIELPLGYEAQVRPRSGLAAKRGLTCLNSPGTIDADYRGELKVILVNLSNETQIIEPAERIAQMVVAKHERIVWSEVTVLYPYYCTILKTAGGKCLAAQLHQFRSKTIYPSLTASGPLLSYW